jgi:hypothetical protein
MSLTSAPKCMWRLVSPATLSLVLAVGCFSHPDSKVSQMVCQTDQNCPTGYRCLVPGMVGGCQKPDHSDLDAGIVIDSALETAGPIDARGHIDGQNLSVDGVGTVDGTEGQEIGSSDLPPSQPFDGPSSPDIVAQPDLPLGSDAAPDITLPPSPEVGSDIVVIAVDLSADLTPAKNDAPQVGPTPTSVGLSAGGITCTSATYKAILTLGQAPGGNTVMRSASYKLIGGLIGATQR